MIHHFKTDRELIGIRLPIGSHGAHIVAGSVLFFYTANHSLEVVMLKKDNYRILIEDVSRATEEQAKGMVEWKGVIYDGCFQDYLNEDCACLTALESLATLLEREKMYSVNPYGAEPDEMDIERYPLSICFDVNGERKALYLRSEKINTAIEFWKEAESHTGVWAIIQRIS